MGAGGCSSPLVLLRVAILLIWNWKYSSSIPIIEYIIDGTFQWYVKGNVFGQRLVVTTPSPPAPQPPSSQELPPDGADMLQCTLPANVRTLSLIDNSGHYTTTSRQLTENIVDFLKGVADVVDSVTSYIIHSGL